ncbi:MAG: nicotinate (nicotinamide) nucleotide adenylyltransferase [Clostridia bacterium]
MKLGVLGGTFNPIHCAHIEMAVLARDKLALDGVLLMVAADPPHKTVDHGVSAADRLQMVRLAVENLDGIIACDLELMRDGKSYMADTLVTLRNMADDCTLYLILGSDMLLDLPNWYRPDVVMQLAKIACIPRLGQEETDAAAAAHLQNEFGAEVLFLPSQVQKLSSTEIRDRLEAGLPIFNLVPPEVERYCYESGVYFSSTIRRMQQILKKALYNKRYIHTMGVVQAAAMLAYRWHAPAEKAQIAALLHDCAKCLDPVTLSVLSGDDTEIVPVWHAFAGAVIALTQYGVTDQHVLRAIRLHSTGDRDMTLLDKLVYLADLIEPNRTYPGVEEYRAAIEQGPDAALLLALIRSKALVTGTGRGGQFHPASERALLQLQEQGEKVDCLAGKRDCDGSAAAGQAAQEQGCAMRLRCVLDDG